MSKSKRITILVALTLFIFSSSQTMSIPGPAQANEIDATDRPKVADRSSSDAKKAKGDINFDDLKFDIEKDEAFSDEKLNEDVEELDGRNVKLRGYILPATIFNTKNIDRFVLVRDNQECCFGPGAALYDCVIVEMQGDRKAEFSVLPVTVEGKFEIDTKSYKYPPGAGPRGATHMAIFRIRGLKVK